MAPDDPEDADPGMARERTRLAWTRTAIAFAAVGAVTLKNDVIIGLAMLAATPLIWAAGAFAVRESRMQRSTRLLLVSVAVTLVALLAAVGALFGHSPASLRDVLPLHG